MLVFTCFDKEYILQLKFKLKYENIKIISKKKPLAV